ncbi:MarR family transcriptional regulator [Kribbella pittospori]|uniref:MarR family transcriptional regulator n=1 Tax=Kribbella pittospori TaxID=722689 RepID=A0A4R0JF33_9ACTN|nr:MarR family winged helix-turn-helix transcriptional regulator [Kribbella pittospori]TCC45421.1 MarR family transcriptional regulator [Kribbella pittospori]
MSTDDSYRLVLERVHRADLLSRRVADRSLAADVGIGRAMFLILDLLASGEPVSQRTIADHLGLTTAAVSRHITTGRDRGWLRAESSPASRREHEVVLTSAGHALVERGRHRRDEAGRRAAGELGGAELRRMARSLQGLCGYLEEQLRER